MSGSYTNVVTVSDSMYCVCLFFFFFLLCYFTNDEFRTIKLVISSTTEQNISLLFLEFFKVFIYLFIFFFIVPKLFFQTLSERSSFLDINGKKKSIVKRIFV
ncbi:unnamed protein product [Camellia sinensis]